MKKVVLVLATALTLFSCEKEIKKTPTTNCDCDRVAKIQFGGYETGTPSNYNVPVYNVYNVTTVNDCSHLNQSFGVTEYNSNSLPKIGECFKK